MEIIRWVLLVLLTVLWACIAGANARIAWREFVARQRGPSPIPLLGLLLAAGMALAAPLEISARWGIFGAAALLDMGSLPYLAHAVVVLMLDAMHIPWRERLDRQPADSKQKEPH